MKQPSIPIQRNPCPKAFFNPKKKFVILSPKKTIFQIKFFLHPACCTDQTNLTKKIPAKDFLCWFERTDYIAQLQKSQFLMLKEKILYTIQRKTCACLKNQIFQMKIFFYNYWEKQLSK